MKQPLTDPVRSSARQFLRLLCVLSTLAANGGDAMARTLDPFESAEPTWRLAETDCQVQITAQQRTFRHPHSGQGCEFLQIQAGRGSYVYLSHSVEPAAVIAELLPSVWVKSDRSGIQLLARVVLPRTKDPESEAPLTTLVRGTWYDNVGSWQQLSIPDIEKQMSRQVLILRSQFGSHVDALESYVDLIVLNVYGGPGVTNLWTDDLEAAGFVSVAARQSIGQPAATAHAVAQPVALMNQDEARSNDEGVRLQGSVMVADGRPLFARTVVHNGESLEFLKSLGFNVIKLRDPPTRSQLEAARRLDLHLITPPPIIAGRNLPSTYDPVLAWDLGDRLTDRQLDQTRKMAEQTRRADSRHGRPLLCSTQSNLWDYSRIADLLVMDAQPLGTSFELEDFSLWLIDRSRLIRPGTPFWAVVQIEPHPEIADQLATISPEAPLADVEPDQIRLLTYSALAAGARGICFQSRSRLDDQRAQMRALTLKLLNLELMLLEPWTAAGSYAGDLSSSDPQVRISVLQTERSRALLVVRHAPGQQFVTAAPQRPRISIVDPGSPITSQAYLVTAAGLTPLRRGRRDPGGVAVSLEDAGLTSLVVLTQDPLVINHVSRVLTTQGQSAAKLQYEIASNWFTVASTVCSRLPQRSRNGSAAASLLQEAEGNLKQCQLLLDANDHRTAFQYADRSMRTLAKLRRSQWDAVAILFSSPVASPCCVSFESLPSHWALADSLRAGRWSSNVLTGGDLENLDVLVSSGWLLQRPAMSDADSEVTLSPQAAHSSGLGLRIRSWATDPRNVPAVMEQPPVSITTAPVQLRAGQLARIHGWIRVPQAIAGSRDGVLVLDSLGGLPLAQRIGAQEDWQEFTLYRAAPADTQMTLTLALSGLGEVWLDDLSVVLFQPPQQASSETERLQR